MNKRLLWTLVALVASVMGMVAFMPSAGAAPSSTSTVCFAGDEGWDFSASSEKWPTAVENKQFTDAGLILDLAQAPRAGGKQAGYVAVNDSLYNAAKYEANGKLGFQYNAVFGPLPGYQLLIDVDNDPTTYDGILVGEAVYGNKWWATKVAKFPLIPDSTGGGSVKSATLQEFLDKYPTVKVLAVGFSLGSGVTGYGTLSSLTFGNQTWKFAKYCGGASTSPTATSTTVPPTSTTAVTTTTTTTTSSSSGAATTSSPIETIGTTFENCTAVWNVLGRPIQASEEGFASKLDSDTNGVGCENDPRVVPVAQVSNLASTGTPFNPLVVGGLALMVVALGGLTALLGRRRRPAQVDGGDENSE